MFTQLFKHKLTYVILVFYLAIVVWSIKIYITGIKETDENYLFGFIYAWIALIGGINGLIVSRKWGGYKSLIGRGIIFFSIGLLGEWFGQTTWSYYNVIAHIEIPYPSLADIGFFSIIPLYSLGMLSFAKAAGSKFNLQTVNGRLIAIFLPLVMLITSYYLFLKDFKPDFSQPLHTFLDFGYPFGEAIFISIALLTFSLSKGILGGKMRSRVLFLVFALVVQYVTESSFLYQAAANTYYNSGPVDLMYATSFAVMSLALIALSSHE